MVAYSFRPRFEDAIRDLTKRQTIRADRKRHARPGEPLQLYTGMRTRQCRLIGRAECISAGPVRLDFSAARVELFTGVTLATAADLDRFAARDGFGDWPDMVAFWADAHPETPVFSGVLIDWNGSFTPGES